MNDLSSISANQPQPSSGSGGQAPNFDMTPPRQALNRSHLSGTNMSTQQQQSLLKQMNSPVLTGLDGLQQFGTNNPQQQPQILKHQTSTPAIPTFQPQQIGSQPMQASNSAGAFDQNTYMQLLQRQQLTQHQQQQPMMSRPGMVQGQRPQSRGRVGGDMFTQGLNNQGDSNILLSPNAQQQHQPNGQANNLANMGNGQQPSGSFLQNFVNQPMPSQITGRSNSQPGGSSSAASNYLNQNLNGQVPNANSQLDMSQLMFRNQQNQSAQPQPQPQQSPINYEQIQLIAQLLQNSNQQSNTANMQQFSQQSPQPQFDQNQFLQQLLMNAQQQQQPVNMATPQMSSRHTQNGSQPQQMPGMPQPNLSLPQMYPAVHPQQFSTNNSQGPPTTATISTGNNGNPQLQQISENVNQYRKLIENYKNSQGFNSAGSASSMNVKPPQFAQNQFSHQQQQEAAITAVQHQQMVLHQHSNSFDGGDINGAPSMTNLANNTSGASNGHIPTYESFMANQQLTANGPQGGSSGLRGASSRELLGAQQAFKQDETTGEGITLVGRTWVGQQAASGQGSQQIQDSSKGQLQQRYNTQSSGDKANNSASQDQIIAWPSKQGVTAGVLGQGQVDSNTPKVAQNRSIPQFQSEEDNSAFLDEKAILGALNCTGNINNVQVEGIDSTQNQLVRHAFDSKSLSPIQVKEKAQLGEQDQQNYLNSFLKGGNEDAQPLPENSQVICEQTKDGIDENNVGDGICWISQQPTAQAEKAATENGNTVQARLANKTEESVLQPKKLFDSEIMGGQDVDAIVIKTQKKTFEELLESQLQKDTIPTTATKEICYATQNPTHLDQAAGQQEEHVTPVKRETAATGTQPKKAFLRRGSSSKYDPKQARKQSQGSSKKFKYYSDNFGNASRKKETVVSAAAKGVSGIPQLNINKQTSQPKAEEKAPFSPKKSSGVSKKQYSSAKANKNGSQSKDTHSKSSDLIPGPPQPTPVPCPTSSFTATQENQKPLQTNSAQSSARLKPPETNARQPNSSRLKFNPPSQRSRKKESSEKTKKNDKSVENIGRVTTKNKIVEEKKGQPTTSQQKATMARLATNKQLFRKQNTNNREQVKSVETKEPSQPHTQVQNSIDNEPVSKKSLLSEMPKEIPTMLSQDDYSEQPPIEVQLESSLCDEPDDSSQEKNSIAEFEMLEKECFLDDAKKMTQGKPNGTKPRKQVNQLDLRKIKKQDSIKTNDSGVAKNKKSQKAQITHESPIRQSAREILRNLKSASTEKVSRFSDESPLDTLELQLMALITEQESEVTRLQEENQRVAVLQVECQKQLERLNKEAQEQEKSKKNNSNDFKKLKTQLKTKEQEIIRLQEELISSNELNQKLKTMNQNLTSKMKVKKKEFTKETQTEKIATRNIMVNTVPSAKSSCQDAQIQVKIDALVLETDELPTSAAYNEEISTPQKHNDSHLTLEEENKSHQVSLDMSPQEPTDQTEQERLTEPPLSTRQIRFSDESCEVNDTEPAIARGAAIVRSARSAAKVGAFQENDAPPKTAKIVTFNLNESMEQKQKQQATETEACSEMIQESDLQADQIDEHPAATTEEFEDEEEEEEEEDYDLVFPELYHSDEAYKNLVKIDEIVSSEGKKQLFFECGKKEIIFPNGVKREVWPDGYQVVFFQNQDIKQTFPGGKIVYFFNEAKTTQSTFPDGLQVFKFQNNQIEKHFPDGTKEISFPDGTIKCLFADGEEESIFPDGTIQKIEKNGMRIIEYPHGQRDYMYPDGTKVREYANGLTKRYNADGTVESIEQNPVDEGQPPAAVDE